MRKTYKIIFILALCLLSGTIVFLVRTNHPAIEWKVFQERMTPVIQGSGLRVVAMGMRSADEVPLPWPKRLSLRFRPKSSQTGFVTGFPECTEDYTLLTPDGQAIHCLVRISEDRVAAILIRFPTKAKQDALHLKAILQKVFPGERIGLKAALNN